MTFRALALLALITIPAVAAADMDDFEKVRSAAQDELVIVHVDSVDIIITRLERALLLSAVYVNMANQPSVISFVDFGIDGTIEQLHYQGVPLSADETDQKMFDALITAAAAEM